MLNVTRVSLLASLVFVAAAAAAPADEAQRLREATDRAAIEALMWRYQRALDTLDVDA